MKHTKPMNFEMRRQFLARALGTGATSLFAPIGLNLAAIANASAQAIDDYKAVVFVNLGGGNDAFNTVVPYDNTSYGLYQRARGGIARDRSSLLPVVPISSQGGREVALNANLTGLKSLFDAGRLAIVSNVGPLIVPVTRATFGSPTTPLPPQLFSHTDQSIYWVSSQSNGGQHGWGGLCVDTLSAQNRNAALAGISAAGYSKLMIGQTSSYFTVSEGGAPDLFFNPGTPLDKAITRSANRSNLLERAYAQVNENLRDNGALLSAAIVPTSTFPEPPPRNSLALQLRTIARVIAARSALGMKRQVFYASTGGFDTHNAQNERHDGLIKGAGDAIKYFDDCMGVINARDKVVLSTCSEFGRTLIPNGDGTDHGWGSHHFVLGGSVKGKDIYGQLPNMDANGPDFMEWGNMIPTTSVEQFGATFANWLGVTPARVSEIFPNLGNFASRDLGFLK